MVDIASLRVLVIDDHFLARQIVSDVMHEMNIKLVATATDGKSGRDAIVEAKSANSPFHVVFVDRDMPNLEGLELVKFFRANTEYSDTAFVMFTSVSEQSEVLAALKAGATGYLIKPVTKQAISKKMKDVMAWLDARPNTSP